jgi:DNA polymerase-3 subunit alpha
VDLRVVNRSIIENLVKAGAFDGLGGNRRQFLQVLEEFIRHVQAQEKQGAQRSLFEIAPEDESPEEPPLPNLDEYSRNALLEFEKETWDSTSPVILSNSRWRAFSGMPPVPRRSCSLDVSGCSRNSGWCGRSAQEKYTKRGDPMGVLEIEDTNAKIEVVAFPNLDESKSFGRFRELRARSGKNPG